MSQVASDEVEITTDGKTVWVNGSGVCLGRFGPRGVDVHRRAEEQLAGLPQCLDCRPVPDWEAFVASMKEHHGVEVDSVFEPEWCQRRSA